MRHPHNRLIERVREYLNPAPRGVVRSNDKSGPNFGRQVAMNTVHDYVNELEQVMIGLESHAAVLRELRADCMTELENIQLEYRTTHARDLINYKVSAEHYVAILETHLAGEASTDEAIEHVRQGYEKYRSELRRASEG